MTQGLTLRLPAEWEPHAATWVVWPQSADWPGKLAPVRWAYCEMLRWLSRHETVQVFVDSLAVAQQARRMLEPAGADMANVHFHVAATNRGWTRDSLPAFVKEGEATVLAAFRFNGWARYPKTHAMDALLPQAVAQVSGLALRPVEHQGRQVVLEGGSIDVNGAGTLLTTDECLLDTCRQVRNPGFGQQDYEMIFRREFGVSNVIWLPGGIAGDDTHGHVDDVCRFVNPGTVVLCQEPNAADPNHAPLARNLDILRGARLQDGSKPEVVALPMPRPLYFGNTRLPASYANFLLANELALVPTFNDPGDRIALGILAELLPGRTVVGIHAVDLVLGLGSIHCLTHEQCA